MISNKKRRILYISNSYKGKSHDYDLLKKEFPASENWFSELSIRLDLGFQGFRDMYEVKELYLPHKKKKAAKGKENELTPEQKQRNKELGKERIYVEHSIGGMKRYRILEHRNRLKSQAVIDRTIGVCAGLWNFCL